MRAHPLGSEAAIIGRVTTERPGFVMMHTSIRGQRIIDLPFGQALTFTC